MPLPALQGPLPNPQNLGYVTLYGKGDFADVMELETLRSKVNESWIIQVSPMESPRS